jgi:hypothetical protein
MGQVSNIGPQTLNPNGYYISFEEAIEQEVRTDGFINAQDSTYLSSYAVELLVELISREQKNTFTDLLMNQKGISRSMRAIFVDKLFGIA